MSNSLHDWRHQVRSWVIRHKHAIKHNRETNGGNLNMRQRNELALLCPGVPRYCIDSYVTDNLDDFIGIDPFHIAERHGKKYKPVDAKMFNGKSRSHQPDLQIIPRQAEINKGTGPASNSWQSLAKSWTLSQKSVVRGNQRGLGVNFTSNQVLKLEELFPGVPVDVVFKYIAEQIDNWYKQDDERFIQDMNTIGKGNMIQNTTNQVPLEPVVREAPVNKWQDRIYNWVRAHHKHIRANRDSLGGNLTGNQTKELEKLCPKIPYRFIFKIVANRMDDWLLQIDNELHEEARRKEKELEENNGVEEKKISYNMFPSTQEISSYTKVAPGITNMNIPTNGVVNDSNMLMKLMESIQSLQAQLNEGNTVAQANNTQMWKNDVYTWVMNHRAHIKHNRRTYGGNLTVRQQNELEDLCSVVPQTELFAFFRTNVNTWLTQDVPPPISANMSVQPQHTYGSSDMAATMILPVPKTPKKKRLIDPNWKIGVEKYVKRNSRRIIKNRRTIGGNFTAKQHEDIKAMYPDKKLRIILQYIKKHIDTWLSKYRSKSATPDDLLYAGHSRSTILSVSLTGSETPLEMIDEQPSLAQLPKYMNSKVLKVIDSEDDEWLPKIETQEEKLLRQRKFDAALEATKKHGEIFEIPDHKIELEENEEGVFDKNEPLIMEWGTANAPKIFDISDLKPRSPSPDPELEKLANIEKNVKKWVKKSKPNTGPKNKSKEEIADFEPAIRQDLPSWNGFLGNASDSSASDILNNNLNMIKNDDDDDSFDWNDIANNKPQLNTINLDNATPTSNQPEFGSITTSKRTPLSVGNEEPGAQSTKSLMFDTHSFAEAEESTPLLKSKTEIHMPNPTVFIDEYSSVEATFNNAEQKSFNFTDNIELDLQVSKKNWNELWKTDTEKFLAADFDHHAENTKPIINLKQEKTLHVIKKSDQTDWKKVLQEYAEKNSDIILTNSSKYNVYFTATEKKEIKELTKNFDQVEVFSWLNDNILSLLKVQKNSLGYIPTTTNVDGTWQDKVREYVIANYMTVIHHQKIEGTYFNDEQKKHLKTITNGVPIKVISKFVNTWIDMWGEDNHDGLQLEEFESIIYTFNYHPIQNKSIYQQFFDKVNPQFIVTDVQECNHHIDVLIRIAKPNIKRDYMTPKFMVTLENTDKPEALRYVNVIQIKEPRHSTSLIVIDSKKDENQIRDLLPADLPIKFHHYRTCTKVSCEFQDYLQGKTTLDDNKKVLTLSENSYGFDLKTNLDCSDMDTTNEIKKCILKVLPIDTIDRFDVINDHRMYIEISSTTFSDTNQDNSSKKNICNIIPDRNEFITDVNYFLQKKFRTANIKLEDPLAEFHVAFYIEQINLRDFPVSENEQEVIIPNKQEEQIRDFMKECISTVFTIDLHHLLRIDVTERKDCIEVACNMQVNDTYDAVLLNQLIYNNETLHKFDEFLHAFSTLETAIVLKDEIEHEIIVIFSNKLDDLSTRVDDKLTYGLSKRLNIASSKIKISGKEKIKGKGSLINFEIISELFEEDIQHEIKLFIEEKFPKLNIIEIN